MSDAAALNIPVEHEIGGTVYRFRQLKLRQIWSLAAWARRKLVAEGQDSLDPKAQVEWMRAVHSLPDEDELIQKQMQSPEGVAHSLYLSMEQDQPNITEEQVLNLFWEHFEEMSALMELITPGFQDDGPKNRRERRMTTRKSAPSS